MVGTLGSLGNTTNITVINPANKTDPIPAYAIAPSALERSKQSKRQIDHIKAKVNNPGPTPSTVAILLLRISVIIFLLDKSKHLVYNKSMLQIGRAHV